MTEDSLLGWRRELPILAPAHTTSMTAHHELSHAVDSLAELARR